MKSILIAGYYGAGNLGDEAILSAILTGLRQEISDVEFTVCSWQPEHTKQLHGVEAVSWTEISEIAHSVAMMDLVIVGGGGLFQDYWGLDPDSYLRRNHGGISTYGSLTLLAEIFGVPCLLFGVGIGPLDSELARKHTLMAAQRCQEITLRDQHAYQQLLETGFDPEDPQSPRVSVFTDPAFGLMMSDSSANKADSILNQFSIPPEAQLLGVNLRYWDRPEPPSVWLPIVAEGIKNFLQKQKGFQVLLLPFQRFDESQFTDDVKICEELYQLLDLSGKIHLVEDVDDPGVMQGLISRCSLLIGMRLHAVIFAIQSGVPPAALSYDPKVERQMKKANLDSICPLPGLVDPDQITTLLMDLFDKRDEFNTLINEFTRNQSKLANDQMEVLRKFISKPHRTLSIPILQGQILHQIQVMERIDQRLDDLTREKAQTQILKEEQQLQLKILAQKIQQIEQSRTYRLAGFLQKIRHWIIPPQSWREKIFQRLVNDRQATG